MGTAFPAEDNRRVAWREGKSRDPKATGTRNCGGEPPSGWRKPPLEHAVPELAVMANVLNPETESITLNTELETPTLDPATEHLSSRRSNPRPTPRLQQLLEAPPLDADALTEPAAQAEDRRGRDLVRASWRPRRPRRKQLPKRPPQPRLCRTRRLPQRRPTRPSPLSQKGHDDFSAALAAFEREQAAEAAAVEAYGDKIVSGKVDKQTDKYLVVDVGLKSEGLVPLEQVIDHTGAVKFQPGDVIDVVIEREEPEGGYLVSYERAQRLRVWDTIEKAANDKTPVMGTVVSRVKGGLDCRHRHEGLSARLAA